MCACVSDLLRPVSRSKTTLASVMEPNSANTCFMPHVYQYAYASQLSKRVDVICENNGVLLQLFGGKGAVPLRAVATRRGMRGAPPVILLACSSASVTKQ